MTDEQRARVREAVTELVERLAAEFHVHREEVSDVAFLYLQKHPVWGRNPTSTQKRASHAYWGGLCQGCKEQVGYSEAVFHHLRRRVPGQHAPDNLLPYHSGCHDMHHNVRHGSLSKGAPKK